MRVTRIVLLVSVGSSAVACGAMPARAQGLDACYVQETTLEQAEQRPSPLRATIFALAGQQGTFCYGQPAARGRTIMGELVPYGTPWRMGANEATALHLPFAATVGDVHVAPGDYSLYAVPSAGDWTIVVNSNAERWGIPINGDVKSADIGSFQVSVSTVEGMVEELTYTWASDGPDAGRMVMTWEHTRLEIPIRRAGS